MIFVSLVSQDDFGSACHLLIIISLNYACQFPDFVFHICDCTWASHPPSGAGVCGKAPDEPRCFLEETSCLGSAEPEYLDCWSPQPFMNIAVGLHLYFWSPFWNLFSSVQNWGLTRLRSIHCTCPSNYPMRERSMAPVTSRGRSGH